MIEPKHASPAKDVRDDIIDAAEERFRHYGYRKTNVGEIAGDVGMSAGNLYRYFENKEDIAAACALRCMSRLDDELSTILETTEISASRRLEQYVLTNLRFNHDQAHNHPHISEMVETVVGQRPDVIHRKIQVTKGILEEIIRQGMETGEFAPLEPAATADALFTALVFFGTPTFMPLYPLDVMETKAIQVTRLLINGLINIEINSAINPSE
ncbi:MAG: TetR/AcrR family transcriptional regulator [Gammaproteobacteria bacterium]